MARRQILDLILIANEVVEDFRSSRKKGIVFKIDFEKAYDRVELSFLNFVLKKKCFGQRWRKWIMGCISSVSCSVFINGRQRDKFEASKGLRQGNLSSSYLFTLAMYALSKRVSREVE